MAIGANGLSSIGVFYDGNYFLHVSNYYNYIHEKKARFSIAGLHDFIISKVAEKEEVQEDRCRIVDAHYFRSRLNARAASRRGNQLFYERAFDDILMSQGISTHYLPSRGVGRQNNGDLELWLALESYEQTLHKKFDVVVLITANGDYRPLIRKINTLGCRVMLLSWDFEFDNEEGERVVTKTSQDLLQEVSYHVRMFDIIDEDCKLDEPQLEELFINNPIATQIETKTDDGQVKYRSRVMTIKSGYGFILYPNNNLFFHHTDVENVEFAELYEGDVVEFSVTVNDKGDDVAKNVVLVDSEE